MVQQFELLFSSLIMLNLMLEPSSFRTLVPFGPGIGQGVQIDYKC